MSYAMSVFNQSTLTYVCDPRDGEAHATRDDAKRELQAWLISEADGTADDEESAALLDDAAQTLNYAEWTQIGGEFDWTVETVVAD